MMRHLLIVLATTVLLAPLSDGLGVAPAAESRQTLDSQNVEKLDAAARNYRIRVYLTFHQYRAEHDRRRAAWDRVEAAWKAAGSPVDKFDTLVGWLSAATRASTVGSVGPLPEIPSFDRPPVEQTPVKQTPVEQPPVKQTPVKQTPVKQTPVEQPPVERPSAKPPIVERPMVERPSIERPVVKPSTIEPPIAKPPIIERPSTKRPSIERPVAKPPIVEQPRVEPRQPPVRYAAPRPLLPGPAASRLGVGERALPRDTTRRSDVPIDGPPPVEVPPVSDLARKVVEKRPSSTSIPSDLPTLEPRLPLPELPQVAEQAGPAESHLQRSEHPTLAGPNDTVERHAAAGQLPSVGATEMGDRSVATPRVKPQAAVVAANRPRAPGPRLVDRPALAAARATLEPTLPNTPPVVEPIDRPPRPSAEPSAMPVPLPLPIKPEMPSRVNLRELAARIAGNNLAVRALESELDKEQTWTARKLEPLLIRLRRLSVRTADLQLYQDIVPEKDRWLVGEAESPRSLVSQLAAGIVEARARATSDQFAGTDADRASELDHLERLSRSLAELARGK